MVENETVVGKHIPFIAGEGHKWTMFGCIDENILCTDLLSPELHFLHYTLEYVHIIPPLATARDIPGLREKQRFFLNVCTSLFC